MSGTDSIIASGQLILFDAFPLPRVAAIPAQALAARMSCAYPRRKIGAVIPGEFQDFFIAGTTCRESTSSDSAGPGRGIFAEFAWTPLDRLL